MKTRMLIERIYGGGDDGSGDDKNDDADGGDKNDGGGDET